MGKILNFAQQRHWLTVADHVFNHGAQAPLRVHRKSLLGGHVQLTSVKHYWLMTQNIVRIWCAIQRTIILASPTGHLRSHWWPGMHQWDGLAAGLSGSLGHSLCVAGLLSFPGQWTQIALMTLSVISSGVILNFRILFFKMVFESFSI